VYRHGQSSSWCTGGAATGGAAPADFPVVKHGEPMPVTSKRRSLVAATGAAVVVLVLAFVALTLLLFVYPEVNAPQRSNAIVVLGGNGAGPFDQGVALARAHDAPTLVSSPLPQYSCGRSLPKIPPYTCCASGPTHRARRVRAAPSRTSRRCTTGTGSSW